MSFWTLRLIEKHLHWLNITALGLHSVKVLGHYSAVFKYSNHRNSMPAGSCSSPNISGNFWLTCARQLAIQFTDSPVTSRQSFSKETPKLPNLYQHIKVIFFILAPSIQTTSCPQKPHIHYPHCLEQTQIHHPTKWKQLLSKVFHLLKYFAKLSHTHTPLVKRPVWFHHTLWRFRRFFLFFYNYRIL